MSTKSNPQDRTYFRGTKVQVASFIDPELHQAVTALAEREGRSIAAVIRRALEAELDRQAA